MRRGLGEEGTGPSGGDSAQTRSDKSGVAGGGRTWDPQPVSGISDREGGLWQMHKQQAGSWAQEQGPEVLTGVMVVSVEMRWFLISPG